MRMDTVSRANRSQDRALHDVGPDPDRGTAKRLGRDNGDGTITVTDYGAGGSRFYDQFGKLVLKDPGSIRFAFDIDYNGTPGDPSDDVEVPDSFRIVRPSTGHSDFSGRDFCADLAEFTS